MRPRIIHATDDGFALAFEPTLKNRTEVIRYIFSKRYLMSGRSIKPSKFAVALGARLLR